MIYFRFFKVNLFFVLFVFFIPFDCEAYRFYENPVETLNKKSYVINKRLDDVILRPITIKYLEKMPNFFVKGLGNVIQNYNDISNVVHSFCQFKVNNFFNNIIRYILNSFFGFFGLYDVGAIFKLAPNKEHYGKTFKYFGYNRSTYLVLPILGSCTIRDVFSLLVNNDFIISKFYLDEYIKYYYIFYILYERIFLLHSERIFLQASVNDYALSKNIYLQYICYKYSKLDI